MAKTTLEKTIEEAANAFALEIVEAVKNATLQELISMQAGTATPKAGRPKKTVSETTAKPGRPKSRAIKTPTPKKGRATKAIRKPAGKKVAKATRNYPKCAYPGCNKNRFARGKGFCGEHWKMSLAGEIKTADAYTK